MALATPTDVRVLHAVRTLGHGDTARIADRLALPAEAVRPHLLDAQARGWITSSTFADLSTWSLTEAGRRHGEQVLADELDVAGARAAVEAVHRDFLPLNTTVSAACTAWQLTEMGIGDRAMTLEETVATLTGPAEALADLEARLTAHLDRFGGYRRRFTTALRRAAADPTWITGTDRSSCHLVWFELHEDLIATLGLTR